VTATRRLAAITAVDVVGYSRLIDEVEAGGALSKLSCDQQLSHPDLPI
jgi:hypothetical protein